MREDVEEVLKSADQMLERLKLADAKSKQTGDVSLSRTDAQIALGQLRTALDYMAVGVDTVLYNGSNAARMQTGRDKLYFPYGDDAGVAKRLAKMYRDLDTTAPKINALFFTVQKAATGSDWLEVVCKLNNRNKHAALVKHERTGGSPRLNIGGLFSFDGNSNVRMSGNTLNGVPLEAGGSVSFNSSDPLEKIAAAFPTVQVTRNKVGEKFILAGTKWEVVTLIETACNGVGHFAVDLMRELGV